MDISLSTTVENGLSVYFATLGAIPSLQNRYESFDSLWSDLEKYVPTTPAGKQNTLDKLIAAHGWMVILSPITDEGVKAWSSRA